MYQIGFTDEFNDQADLVIGGLESQQELRLHYENALTNYPDRGKRIPGTALWALVLRTRRPITIYYSIDDAAKLVTLLHVTIAENPTS